MVIGCRLTALFSFNYMFQEYRIAAGWRIFAMIGAALIAFAFIALTVIVFRSAHPGPGLWLMPLLTLLMLTICVSGALDAVRSRLTIDDREIVRTQAFSTRVLPVSEVKGYTRTKNQMWIEPAHDHFPRIKISEYFENGNELKSLIRSRFTDLDQQRLEQEEQEMLADESLGATQQEREERLAAARRYTRILNAAALISVFWAWIYPHPYELCIIVVALIPFIGFFLLSKYRGIIRLAEKPKSAHPNLTMALIFPALGLLIRSMADYKLLNFTPIIGPAAGVGMALCLLMWFCAGVFSQNRELLRSSFYLVIFALYGAGALTIVNCHEDKHPAQVFTTEVISKRVTHGKSTSYHVKLAPWGPRTDDQETNVSRDLYNALEPGQPVQVCLEPGALGMPWFYITP